MPRWISTVSVSWRPTESTGFSEVIGSWKIIPISRPRIRRISSSESVRRSRPLNTIWPPTIWPAGAATRRITERALTDLPHPDSPTSATVSPARTSHETPSTARTTPAEVVNWVWRSLTSSRTLIGGSLPRAEGALARQPPCRRPARGAGYFARDFLRQAARIARRLPSQLRRPPVARVNDHYLELKASYLFSDIAKRVQAFGAANPGAHLIRLGIG